MVSFFSALEVIFLSLYTFTNFSKKNYLLPRFLIYAAFSVLNLSVSFSFNKLEINDSFLFYASLKKRILEMDSTLDSL